MICPYCNKTLPDHAHFCAHCGNSLQESKLPKVEAAAVLPVVPKKEKAKKGNTNRKRRSLAIILILLVGGIAVYSGSVLKIGPLKGLMPTMDSLESKLNENSSELVSLSPSDKNIVADEDYVYWLSENNTGTIYRLNKETYQMDLMCEPYVSPGEVEGEYLQLNPNAITLYENDLYFSLKYIATEYATAYFRMPKEGGEVEFLFLLPESYMETDGENIYFLCHNTNRVGVYDPKTGGLPRFKELMGSPSNPLGSKPLFSISKENIYYMGEEKDEFGKNLYKTNLASGESEILVGNENENFDWLKAAIFSDAYLYYMTDFYGDISLVRQYDLNSGENKILSGVKGMDYFLSAYDGKLIVPDKEPGIYASLDLKNLSNREECYRGKEYETDNSIENSVNAIFGRPAEAVKTVIEREELSQQCEGYVFSYYEGRNLNTGTDFSWSAEIDSYTPLTVLAQQAAVKEGVKWMVLYKGEDVSNGVEPM
jgi:hypothetical protein